MNSARSSIRVNVNATNPGQFFACCGLLELADRLWTDAKGWFEGREFCIGCQGTMAELMSAVCQVKLVQSDPDDNTSSPIEIGDPFRVLRLDWWHDDLAGGKEMKVWAGTMESVRIAQAMQHAMHNDRFSQPSLFDVGLVARDPEDIEKKVEPYYFDSRRGPNAHSRDVGFSPNDLQMTTTAFPAVELFCLIGLQRCLPAKTKQRRVFDYYTWRQPLPTNLVAAAACGMLSLPDAIGYRFENWYRTGQRKHKAFLSAIPLSTRGQT